jgi:ATP-dependent exoDNAse (exonuclease V) beta subunit
MEQIVRCALDVDTAVEVTSLPADPDRMVAEAVVMTRTGKELLQQAMAEGWQVVGVEWPLMLGDRKVLGEIAPDCDVQVVTGVADLILRAADGRLRVVDFKTDDSGDRDLRARYGAQLGAYRAALGSATGEEVSAQIWDLAAGTRIEIS